MAQLARLLIVCCALLTLVRWTAKLLSRLTEKQCHDAFRAGGYSQQDATRYIAKFKEKIAVGLALQ